MIHPKEQPTGTPPLTAFNRCNSTALRKATRRISQFYDAMIAPSGIRGTQRAILMQIARKGATSISDLAEDLILDRTAMSQNLKPLVREGLVSVRVDKTDRRGRVVALTKAGDKKLEESMPLWQNAQNAFEEAFGVERARELRDALLVIAQLELPDDTPSDRPQQH